MCVYVRKTRKHEKGGGRWGGKGRNGGGVIGPLAQNFVHVLKTASLVIQPGAVAKQQFVLHSLCGAQVLQSGMTANQSLIHALAFLNRSPEIQWQSVTQVWCVIWQIHYGPAALHDEASQAREEQT